MFHLTLQIVCPRSDTVASVCAVARALPLYSRKSGNGTPRTVTLEFLLVSDSAGRGRAGAMGELANHTMSSALGQASSNGPVHLLTADERECVSDVADSVRLTARITDTPCLEMDTSHFIKVHVQSCLLFTS